MEEQKPEYCFPLSELRGRNQSHGNQSLINLLWSRCLQHGKRFIIHKGYSQSCIWSIYDIKKTWIRDFTNRSEQLVDAK
jgi:hypothetical protein